jgi:hypothetical protein
MVQENGAPGKQATPKRRKLERTYELQGGLCFYCRETMTLVPAGVHRPELDLTDATWDHRVPKSRGGTGLTGNRVLACRACNVRKSSMTDEEFRAILKPAPVVAMEIPERIPAPVPTRSVQRLILETDASRFTSSVNNALHAGSVVIPGTLLIAAVTESDGQPGVRYAVVVRDGERTSHSSTAPTNGSLRS